MKQLRITILTTAFVCAFALDAAAERNKTTCGSDVPVNPTQWVIRPDGDAQASYRVWLGGAYIFQNYQSLPFEITVTKP